MSLATCCRAVLACCLASSAIPALAAAEMRPPLVHPLFGTHMVFPRDRTVSVWGWTTPGAPVEVTLASQSVRATAGSDGRWQVALAPIPAGGPYVLRIAGPETVALDDVLVGEVWLASGQSNMALNLLRAEGGTAEAATAEQAAGLRLFVEGSRLAAEPVALPPGKAPTWAVPDAKQAGAFSAVGWFAGRALQRALNVPVGVVLTAYSGSNIRAWLPETALTGLGLYGEELALLHRMAAIEKSGGASIATQDQATVDAWWQEHDPGTHDGWSRPEVEPKEVTWSAQEVPGAWRENGATWLRRDLDLPADWKDGAARLQLGPCSEEDVTWVNGKQIGALRSPAPRAYTVPAGLLHAGRNRIAIRLWAEGGQGRITGNAADCRLEPAGEGAPIVLAGTWQRATTLPARPARPRLRFQGGNGSATMLFNGGVASLAPFPFSGVWWYQGEQDAGNPDYARLLPTLISTWRQNFAQPQLPVVLVGLPGFHPRVTTPVQDNLSFGQIRAVQLAVATAIPGVGVAVTTDLGDPDNVHPLRKREVGERLAAATLAIAYGRAGGGGPLFVAATPSGAAMRVTLDHISGGGLELRPGEPSGFALAGADHVWHHAQAKLDGDAVVVTSSEVQVPVAVRYGWADCPPCTLFDRAGFAAMAFKSDR